MASSPCRERWKCIKQNRHFYLFISPFFILFAVFGLYPLVFSLFLSFVKWDGLTPRIWVGLSNFASMLEDEILLTSLWNTLIIGVLYIPAMLILAFLFAVCLDQQWLRLRGFLRASFFLPCITPMVVIAMVFSLLYSPESGLLNYVIVKIGRLVPFAHLEPIPWINSARWSKFSLALLTGWRWTGYNMVLMLAGLQGIPDEYYEAAKVDGATLLRRLWHITLPLMRPMFLFCGIMSMLGTLYMFDEVFVLTKGGPGISSTNFGLFLFNTSFVDFRFGYGSAVAYTVALAVFLISLAVLRFARAPET